MQKQQRDLYSDLDKRVAALGGGGQARLLRLSR
jgi:hypothetical protein